jgi:hypothetical protein
MHRYNEIIEHFYILLGKRISLTRKNDIKIIQLILYGINNDGKVQYKTAIGVILLPAACFFPLDLFPATEYCFYHIREITGEDHEH